MEQAEFAAKSKRLSTSTAVLLAGQWDASGLWEDRLYQASAVLAAGQVRSAQLADEFAVSQMGAADVDLQPRAFAGVAPDGRSLPGLLRNAATVADAAPDAAAARKAARQWLTMAALTVMADTSRAAMRSAMAVRNATGYRVANVPCCQRCAVLHGRFYHWRADFPRHPRCDCGFLPVAQGESVDPPDEIPLDQIRDLSKADREAIELGADRARVINAHRGMESVTSYGKPVKATSEGMTKRGDAYKRLVRDRAERLGLTEQQLAARTDRLRPESILAQAKDQEDAIRLLRLHGYMK